MTLARHGDFFGRDPKNHTLRVTNVAADLENPLARAVDFVENTLQATRFGCFLVQI